MKDKKLLLIVLILVLFVSIGKETYALFTSEVSSVVQSYGTGTLKLSYSSTVININNAYPMSDSDGMNTGSGIITITNTGTLAYKFDVKIDVSSNSTLSSDLIKVSVDEQKPAILSMDGNIIIRDIVLNPGSSRSFALKLWIDSKATSSEVLGKKFIGNLTSSGIAVRNMDDSVGTVLDGSIYNYIKSKADTATQIDFSKTSEQDNTNGIYMTTDTDSGSPVYYYRGNVDNHVLFANFCWRIVRTTGTGGVKLIYNGVPTDGQCNNKGANATIGESQFSSSGSPADAGYMYGTRYIAVSKTMSSLSGSIIFGNDITYANGTYILTDTYTLTDASNWSSEYSTIASKYHYTCFTSSDTCTRVNYIHYTTSSYSYYFQLSDGKNHLDILKEMLDNSTNTYNSEIKTFIDTWYQNNMTSYTSQLEDTVFCNDRSYDVSKSGWDKDYSNSDNYLYFGSYQRMRSYKPTLKCANANDKFTVESSNGNGALTYPVGLITIDEIAYAGEGQGTSNSSFYLYTGQYYWALSPYAFDNACVHEFALSSGRWGFSGAAVISLGNLKGGSVSGYSAVRASVSLKPGITITGGSGTAADPFVVE